jgi:hypothetical protein
LAIPVDLSLCPGDLLIVSLLAGSTGGGGPLLVPRFQLRQVKNHGGVVLRVEPDGHLVPDIEGPDLVAHAALGDLGLGAVVNAGDRCCL